MKKKQNLFVGLVAALLLSSCSQEELGEQGMALPEGEYPLQIGSVTLTAEVSEQSWTRVSENPTDGMSSVWEGNEQIGVQIGSGQPGIYTVQDDGSVVAINPVYWTNPTNETVDLSNQSNGLAYVLEATQDPVTYEQSVTLNFTHKLAKVRVVLNGTQAGQVESVEIYGITACNHLQPPGKLVGLRSKQYRLDKDEETDLRRRHRVLGSQRGARRGHQPNKGE